MDRHIINPWSWQDQYGFVQANKVSGERTSIYCAGQVSVDEEGNIIHARDIVGQVRQCFNNLSTVLAEAGADLSHVVRLRYYITDMNAFRDAWPMLLEEILPTYNCRPASTLLGVAFLYHPDVMIEIEAMAVI